MQVTFHRVARGVQSAVAKFGKGAVQSNPLTGLTFKIVV